jgi:NAD(P)-dependent dehydrogenase (short-subunit alcohol dehydrogenase family)
VNLGGFFHITRRAIEHMEQAGIGHVVDITTTLVEHANVKVPSALASLTKGGLAAVTKSLATEYADERPRERCLAGRDQDTHARTGDL